jgi:hypothetical protein
MTTPIEDAILSQLATAGPGKSIDPMNIAKEVQPERWQRLLPLIKREAVMLARQGVIVILRHNKPADPGDFRGVYRIRLPLEGDPPISAE